jgi:hypothetical protein
MSSATYQPVGTVQDEGARSLASPSLESSSNDRLTPQSEEEEADGSVRESWRGSEDEGGWEMKELGLRKDDQQGHIVGGADEESDDESLGRVVHKPRRRASVQSFELYTPDEERAVRRKLDTHLVLFVALLYLLSFLDRSNM